MSLTIWKSFRMAPPLFHSIWNNIVSNLPHWYIHFCKNKWKSGGAIRKVIHQPFEHKGPTDTAYNINHVYYMLLLNVKLNIDKAMVKYLAQSGPCSMLNQMTRPGIRIQTPTVADDKQYTGAGDWWCSSTNWSYINCMQCSWQMQRQYELNKKDY